MIDCHIENYITQFFYYIYIYKCLIRMQDLHDFSAIFFIYLLFLKFEGETIFCFVYKFIYTIVEIFTFAWNLFLFLIVFLNYIMKWNVLLLVIFYIYLRFYFCFIIIFICKFIETWWSLILSIFSLLFKWEWLSFYIFIY